MRLYGDSDHPDVSKSYHNLGAVYDSLGQYEKAEKFYTKSLEMMLRLYGDSDHPDVSGVVSQSGLGL